MKQDLLSTIELENQPMACCFHPKEQLLAIGLVTGRLQVFRHSDGKDPKLAINIKAHSDSCRTVVFAQGGQLAVSASADRCLLAVDVETGKPVSRRTDAHTSGINRATCVSDTVLASGDDGGTVSLWDLRQRGCCGSVQAHKEFVADLTMHEQDGLLLAVSGDGTLSVIDPRKTGTATVTHRTEDGADDELLSVVVLKRGKKVLAGAQSGVLNLYSWGAMNDCSDRFPGHPESVDALAKFDDETVLTGSSDGLIRLVSILPNRLLAAVGEHGSDPIEALAIDPTKRRLASASHDDCVKVWGLDALFEEDDEGEEEDEQEGGDGLVMQGGGQAEEKGGDGGENDGDGDRGEVPEPQQQDGSGGSSSDSDEGGGGGGPKRKRGKKGQHKIRSKKHTKHSSFFSDLL